MTRRSTLLPRLLAASAAAMLCAAPAAQAAAGDKTAGDKTAATKPAKKTLSQSRRDTATRLSAETLGSFTPPTLEALRKSGNGSASVQERTFRFTPSGSTERKALSIGVTSRVVKANAPEPARPAEPVASAYNVDVAVAYRGFAVSGGFSRLDSLIEPGREGVDLGLSYRGDRWKTALQLNADALTDRTIDPLALDRRYSVELGGAYALSSRLSLTGGVKYQLLQPETFGRNFVTRGGQPLASDGQAGSVYLGGSISF